VECICVPKTSYFKKKGKIMIKKRNLLAGDREGDHEVNLKPIKGFVPPGYAAGPLRLQSL
jgi:hypothetical protein